jgi:hydrogenase expression/formation protein HypC
MCLSVPFKIVEVHGTSAMGDYMGLKKNIRIDFVPSVKVNDFVMVHAGFAMQIIDNKTSKEVVEILEEIKNDK